MGEKENNPELPHMINLVMGDWSGDGHRETATVTIFSNITKAELEKAYKAGARKVKVKFEAEVAERYEDNCISVDVVAKLTPHGFKISDYSEDEEPGENGYSLWTDGYSLIWLWFAQLGNPSFRFEMVKNDSPNINIGGYGLFS